MSKRGGRSYSPAWRTGTTIYLPPLIRSTDEARLARPGAHPPPGGMIVAANHLSYADWAAMALFIHQAGRYPAFLIKSSLFDVKGIGTIPARRSASCRSTGARPTRRWCSRTPSAASPRANA